LGTTEALHPQKKKLEEEEEEEEGGRRRRNKIACVFGLRDELIINLRVFFFSFWLFGLQSILTPFFASYCRQLKLQRT